MNKRIKKQSGLKDAGITVKFSLAFVLLLLLIMMTAATGYISLTIAKKAEQQIEQSARVEQLVLGMDRAVEQARRLHSEFLLLHPTLGLSQAHKQYAQPSARKIAQAILLSISLREQLARPEVNETIQLEKVNMNLYLSTAKRFAQTSIETVQLITERSAPKVGLEDQLEITSCNLQQKITNFPTQAVLLTHALLHSKEYLIKRQRSNMQSAFNHLHDLRNVITSDPSQSPHEKEELYDDIDQFQSTAKQLLELDLAIQAKFRELSLLEKLIIPVSHELLSQANQQVAQTKKRIRKIRRNATGFMIAIGLFAVFSTLFIANLLHKNVTGKIIRLTRAADEFRGGNLEVIFPNDTKDELGTLALTFTL
ncbi:MAG: HAMP domain-containing protein, partial [Candidatus Electrothrix sp. ATG2]|nr:HAMP domain-containing protein [Candidatus Electrothrix sp. ATG2]